jgi:hypothetical protein
MSATALARAARPQRAVQPAHRFASCSVHRSCHSRLPRCVAANAKKGKGNPFRPVSTHELKPREPKKQVAPPGKGKYETLIILKPTLTDEERDQELARFESFLISVRAFPVYTFNALTWCGKGFCVLIWEQLHACDPRVPGDVPLRP